jgi:hypothetical protein
MIMALVADSIPCAFSGLEEFILRVKETGLDDGPHSADLVALLEAAPGLRRVRLEGIPNLTSTTVTWLARYRPGFQMEVGDRGVVLELPPTPLDYTVLLGRLLGRLFDSRWGHDENAS